MGNYSFLLAVRNNPNQCSISWETIKKEKLTHYYFDDLYDDDENRPKTLEDLANYLDEKKFIGYLTKEFIETLEEICKNLVPNGYNPRLFYEYEGMAEIWCVEFIPGTGIVNVAVYDYHEILSSLPRYPPYESELYNEWNTMYTTVENYCKKSCIDNYIWDFQRLEQVELTGQEQWINLQI